jgi:hypothetical protein
MRCLRDFIAGGIDVVLIDHGSTDDTVAKAGMYLDNGLLAIETLPWNGVFSLTEQLVCKAAIAARSRHDWIIHADADERFEPLAGNASLRHSLGSVDRAGYNAVNFREFVFAPLGDEDFAFDGYEDAMRTYYYFDPTPGSAHFMRAWKRELAGLLPAYGGHRLSGPAVRLAPSDFTMRHYITLSHGHAVEKFGRRQFPAEELAQGWHHNRVAIEPSALWLAPRPELRFLAHPQSREYDTSAPQVRHYWQWAPDAVAPPV